MTAHPPAAETFTAWAISHHIPGHPAPSFCGVFTFGHDPRPVYTDGCRTALFPTRRAARDALAGFSAYARTFGPRVAKVRVVITEIAAP